MGNPRINRFEWLKAALQCRDLTDRAKALASAFAIQFANDETGQINPSITTLSEYLGASKDTIKRAVADLVKGGWLTRTEGRGAGNHTVYSLLSPGEVVAFAPQKKGASMHSQTGKKGAAVHRKGGRTAPFYNKDKQSFEQKARSNSERPSTHLHSVVHHGTDAEIAWNKWLTDRGDPKLIEIGQPSSDANGTGWDMPWRWPPQEGDEIACSIAAKHVWWLINRANERRRA